MESPAVDLSFIHRSEEIALLKRLLSPSRHGIDKLHDLAMRFSNVGWKELFIRYWQQQSRCESELELKIRELGGIPQIEANEEIKTPLDPEDEPVDPLSLDRRLLLNAVNYETHVLQLYAEIRKVPLSFDVRMMLQRHHLQIRELTEKLTSIYLMYPHTTQVDPSNVSHVNQTVTFSADTFSK